MYIQTREALLLHDKTSVVGVTATVSHVRLKHLHYKQDMFQYIHNSNQPKPDSNIPNLTSILYINKNAS